MARYMTRRERQRRVTEHFYTPRVKLFAAIIVAVVAAVLVAGILASLTTRQDPIIAVLLGIGLLIWVTLSIFLMDMLLFQTN